MGRRRLPALCGGRAVTRVRKRVRVSYSSSSSRPPASATSCGGKIRNAAAAGADGGCRGGSGVASVAEMGGGAGAGAGKRDGGGRRVMVVADGRSEAVDALDWALSQAVRSNDVVLLAVVRPAAAADGADCCVKMSRTRCCEYIDAMKSLCESIRPEVTTEVCVVEAEERAPAVVDAARRHGASLLVLGQRRRAVTARWLLGLWPAAAVNRRRRSRGGARGLVEYCIEHAPCEALGVRRRSSGGYLVSSKRHKDFWLLA